MSETPTVDEALAIVEQERFDELVALEAGELHYEAAPYVLASEVRKLRRELSAAKQTIETLRLLKDMDALECSALVVRTALANFARLVQRMAESTGGQPFYVAPPIEQLDVVFRVKGSFGVGDEIFDVIRALASQEAARPAEEKP